MPTNSSVILMSEGLTLPPGYQEVVIEKGNNAGRYAVKPKPRCRWCITNDPGFMSTVVPGEKKTKRSPCSCVLSAVVEFLRPKRLQPGRVASPPKPKGKGALELQVEHIDRVIAQKQRYIAERAEVVALLTIERDQALAEEHDSDSRVNIQVEYQGAINRAMSDSRYCKYQTDIKRLQERREKLNPSHKSED